MGSADKQPMTLKDKCWLVSPFIAILLAILSLSLVDSVGLDGAARSVGVLFWFAPVILFAGIKSISVLLATRTNKWLAILMTLLWVLPSMPLMIMSFMGFLLICEIGAAFILS